MINPISLLFAPYFIFIETFYPSSFEQKETYDATKKSIICFAGQFYPYHVSFWIMYTVYHNYMYIHFYNKTELFLGFFVMSTLWSFTE